MSTFLKLKASTLFTLTNQITCNQNNFYKSSNLETPRSRPWLSGRASGLVTAPS